LDERVGLRAAVLGNLAGVRHDHALGAVLGLHERQVEQDLRMSWDMADAMMHDRSHHPSWTSIAA